MSRKAKDDRRHTAWRDSTVRRDDLIVQSRAPRLSREQPSTLYLPPAESILCATRPVTKKTVVWWCVSRLYPDRLKWLEVEACCGQVVESVWGLCGRRCALEHDDMHGSQIDHGFTACQTALTAEPGEGAFDTQRRGSTWKLVCPGSRATLSKTASKCALPSAAQMA